MLRSRIMPIQWNPSIAETFGSNVLAFIQRWPSLRGCFVHKLFIWAWPLYIATGLYSEVVVNRARFHCTWNAIAAFSEECIAKLVHGVLQLYLGSSTLERYLYW